MALWRSLHADLQRLEQERPPVLLSWPSPDPEGPAQRRYSIALAAHAEDVAAGLHARYGNLVDLRVGLLPYPGPKRRGPTSDGRRRPQHFSAADGARATEWGLSVELAEPAPTPRIRSGFSSQVPVRITNRSDVDRHLHTNGVLQTSVVDTASDVIAGYAGFQQMALRVFTARAGESIQVPALVGTASRVPALGFAVPRGTWAFVVELALGGSLGSSSPRKNAVAWSSPLPLLVVARR